MLYLSHNEIPGDDDYSTFNCLEDENLPIMHAIIYKLSFNFSSPLREINHFSEFDFISNNCFNMLIKNIKINLSAD